MVAPTQGEQDTCAIHASGMKFLIDIFPQQFFKEVGRSDGRVLLAGTWQSDIATRLDAARLRLLEAVQFDFAS